MRLRPLLIGQAPGPRTDPALPLYPVPKTSAGGRLQQLMGLKRRQYLQAFDRVNLLYCFPGQHKRDDKFPLTPAKTAAAAMRPLLARRTVILVGRNVANAFGFEAEWHEWTDWRLRDYRFGETVEDVSARAVVVPHPSGRNHWYNKEENREEARQFWSKFISESCCLFSGDDRE